MADPEPRVRRRPTGSLKICMYFTCNGEGKLTKKFRAPVQRSSLAGLFTRRGKEETARCAKNRRAPWGAFLKLWAQKAVLHAQNSLPKINF